MNVDQTIPNKLLKSKMYLQGGSGSGVYKVY